MDKDNLKKLGAKMEKGEKILWYGRPEPFAVMDKTHRNYLCRRFIFSALGILAVMVAYALAARHFEVPLKPVIVILIVAAGAFACLREWIDAAAVRSKIWYGVTDRRLVWVDDTVSTVRFEAVPKAAFRSDDDGHVSLLCGKAALRKKPERWRSAAAVKPGCDTESGICEQLVFYAIPEADKVKKLLERYIPLE